MCKVYTGYCGTSEIEHGLCACTVDNPLAKARGLSLRTGAQTMLYSIIHSLKLGDYLSVQAHKPCSISHLFAQKKIDFLSSKVMFRAQLFKTNDAVN